MGLGPRFIGAPFLQGPSRTPPLLQRISRYEGFVKDFRGPRQHHEHGGFCSRRLHGEARAMACGSNTRALPERGGGGSTSSDNWRGLGVARDFIEGTLGLGGSPIINFLNFSELGGLGGLRGGPRMVRRWGRPGGGTVGGWEGGLGATSRTGNARNQQKARPRLSRKQSVRR